MKKVMMALALISSMFMYSQAQPGGGRGGRPNPEDRAKRTAEDLEKELKLSPAQKDSVYSYVLSQSKEQQTLFKPGQGNEDREATMAKFKSLQEKTDTKIKSLLTDDQKTKYDAYLKQREERMKKFRGGPRGGEHTN
ncbi:hypothetical protein SAMN05216436_10842 [bacterium A37T11]|nr:hypothetical protein SAMN05216436_10842 [bacterium A37T11]